MKGREGNTLPNQKKEQEKPAEPQANATAAVGAAPIVEHPEEPKRRKRRARHEAGHAVGIDQYGGETLSINISKTNGKDFKAVPKWPPFDIADAEVKIFQRETTVVAGPIAEKQLDQELGMVTKLVSEMVTDGTEAKCASMDVAKTLNYLRKIGQCTRARIIEAEQKAVELLAERKDHLDELAKELEQHRYLEAPAIRKALGKGEANPPAPPLAPGPEQAPPG